MWFPQRKPKTLTDKTFQYQKQTPNPNQTIPFVNRIQWFFQLGSPNFQVQNQQINMNSVIFIGIIILTGSCILADNGSSLGFDSMDKYQIQVYLHFFFLSILRSCAVTLAFFKRNWWFSWFWWFSIILKAFQPTFDHIVNFKSKQKILSNSENNFKDSWCEMKGSQLVSFESA